MRIDVLIHDGVSAQIGAVKKAGLDMQPLFDAIGMAMEASTIERFEAEIAPDGTPWPKSRRVESAGGKTLQVSGHLKDSVTHEADAEGVTIGTNVIYAGIHQEGGKIRPVHADYLAFNIGGRQIFTKEVNIPARPMFGVSAEDEETIAELAGDYLGGPLQ